MPSNSEMKDQ